MSNSALNELGFAEFVAKLISDTFSAILSAQTDQKEKITELRRLLASPTESLVDQLIEDPLALEQVDRQLQQLFPADNALAHAIFEKAPYQAQSSRLEEQPPIFKQIGLEMLKNTDYDKNGLTLAGVNKIKRHLLAETAEQQRIILADMLNEGIPKLVIDSGKINAKLTFRTETEENQTDSQTPEATIAKTQPALTFDRQLFAKPLYGIIDAKKLLHTRLKITPASNQAPQDAQTSANIYSEIEIHFKTIL